MPTCDWGHCDAWAVAFRYDHCGHGWLPVCKDHVSANPSDMDYHACLVCATEPCSCPDVQPIDWGADV